MAAPHPDPFYLDRFVQAQRPIYDRALAELRAGSKRTHWMWFVLPQLAGLGSSYMAQKFAIGSLDEARAYLAHPVLGPRLLECVAAINSIEGRTAHEILGSPDDMKFRSCLTLFEAAAPDQAEFAQALDIFFNASRDPATHSKLNCQQ